MSHFDNGGRTCKSLNGMSCMRSEKDNGKNIHFMYSDCPEVHR